MSYYLEDADNSGYLGDGLEIQKLIQSEKKALAGSEFDVLHEKVKTANQTEKMEEELKGGSEEESATDDTSTAPVEEDTPPEGDEEATNPFDGESQGEGEGGENKAPEGDNKPDDKTPAADETKTADQESADDEKNDQKSKVVSESLRDVYTMHYSPVVLEEITKDDVYDTAAKVGGVAYRVVSAGVSVLFEFAKTLVGLGIRHGPGIAEKFRKGVIYLFTRSVKVLFTTIAATSDFIKRHYNSVSSIKKDLAALQKTSAELDRVEIGDFQSESFTDEKAIPWFSYGKKAGVPGSASEILHFLDATIDPMAKRVLEDIGAVHKLITMTSINGVRGNVLTMMNVNPIGGEYDRKVLKNYPIENSDVETYVYQRSLPNNVIFVTNLPKNNLNVIESVSAAYKDSSIFMGVDTTYSDYPQALPYLNKAELDKYIGQLVVIADLLQQHTEHYVRIANESKKLKLSYRHYYQKLSAAPEKVSLHDSLAEFVFLKQSFASKTYIAGMIDIHDYVTAYLVRATRFAKKNLRVLATAKPSENPPE